MPPEPAAKKRKDDGGTVQDCCETAQDCCGTVQDCLRTAMILQWAFFEAFPIFVPLWSAPGPRYFAFETALWAFLTRFPFFVPFLEQNGGTKNVKKGTKYGNC